MTTKTKPATAEDLSAVARQIRRLIPQIEPCLYIVPMRIEASPALCPTAYTDGRQCVFGAEFLGALPAPKRVGLMLHEVLHLVRGDCSVTWVDTSINLAAFRQLMNIAQDIVLEAQIAEIAQKLWSGPVSENPLLQPYHTVEQYSRGIGKSWREVYAELKAEAQKQGQQGQSEGQVGGGGGTVDDHEQWQGAPLSQSEKEQLAVRVRRAQEASAAISAALAAGKGTGGQDIDITPAAPVAPWQTILRDALISIPAPMRRTWSKVSRRAFAIDRTYKPGRIGSVRALDKLTLFVDTSGSMRDLLDTAGADIMALLAGFTPSELDIVYYDGEITGQTRVKRQDIRGFTLTTMPGGGGTCIATALAQYVKQRSYAKRPIVVLTDGYDNYTLPEALGSRLGHIVWASYAEPVNPSHGIAVQLDMS